MKPNLRPETDDDIDFLRGLYANTRVWEVRSAGLSHAQSAVFLAQQFQAMRVDYRSRYPQEVFSLVEVDGEPVGKLYVHRADDGFRIVDFALVPERRRRGLGRRRVSQVLDEAITRGLPVRGHVKSMNPDRPFWTAMGFVEADGGGPYVAIEWRPPGCDRTL